MHSTTTTTSNRPRRRIGRALLAAAVAACVLPAAAQASTVEEAADGTLVYRAAAGESNSLSVTTQVAGAVSIRDLTGLTERTPLCDNVSSIRVNCVPDTRLSEVRLGDRNDNFAFGVPGAVVVDAGPGDDSYTAANVGLFSSVDYRGGDGFDHVSYSNADRGVRLSNDGAANDGRIGFDRDNIRGDVEQLEGSAFADEITGAATEQQLSRGQALSGGFGDDVLRVTSGDRFATFEMGRSRDGADRIIGGPGFSTVDYSERTQPVNVTLNFGGADDGEAVEGDEIIGSNERVAGGKAGDTIRAPAGSTARHGLAGGDGDDRIDGADGPDRLDGGDGVDTIAAFGGNDLISAKDGFGDIVGCGLGDDKADLDPNTVDVSSSCERRGPITLADVQQQVGVLRLTPKAQRVRAGETARLRLSWRHPRSWRQLRRVTLRLYRGDKRVGRVTIRPRGRQLRAHGTVSLVRKHSRLTRKGKTVSARLALRLDRSLAGRTLKVEVEASDRRGRRQLEREAGRIRVAG